MTTVSVCDVCPIGEQGGSLGATTEKPGDTLRFRSICDGHEVGSLACFSAIFIADDCLRKSLSSKKEHPDQNCTGYGITEIDRTLDGLRFIYSKLNS